MNTFALDIWDDEASRCTFYTVRWEDSDTNETDKFFNKFESNTKYKKESQVLVSFLLDAIGENHGAKLLFFNRPENEVAGLPPKGRIQVGEIAFSFPDFPLRLYALRITNELVILFNGGIKDGPTNQKSSLHFVWKEACAFAQRIDEALQEGILIIDHQNRRITYEDDNNEIYL